MCDYSLHAISSRPAKAGDKLVTSSFMGTTTHGFSAAGEPGVAVCLLPGTELAFEKDVECRVSLFSFFKRKLRSGRLARFRQINRDKVSSHHDAVEFPNGKLVLLTDLREGQKAVVLQLPATAKRLDRSTEGRQDGPTIDLVPTGAGAADRSEWSLIR